MRVKILDVNIENVIKGKSRYSKATVAYSFNGEARTQSVMSFSNPAVYAAISKPEIIGTEVEVTVTKNDGGYNQWSGIGEAGTSSPDTSPRAESTGTAAPTRVTGSNYETPAERAQKQVYIVKQSSITAALSFLKDSTPNNFTQDDVIKTAQVFVDFVFDTDKSMAGLKSDEL